MKVRKPKAIVFIGFSQKINTITSAKEAGYKTVLITAKLKSEAMDHFDEVIEKDVAAIEQLKQVITYIRENYLVKSVLTNYERFVVPRSYFAEHFGIPTCSVYAACCTRNKAMQRHALSFMKENIPYRIIKNRTDALLAYKDLGPTVFLKSISGLRSALIFKATDEETLLDSYQKMLDGFRSPYVQGVQNPYEYCRFRFDYPNPSETFLVEKAIEGQQISIDSVVGDFQIWHAPSVVDIYPYKGCGNLIRILGSKIPREIQLKAKEVVSTAIRVLGMQHCAAHTELFITPEGDVKIIEIASRIGGFRPEMYDLAYGLNLSDQLIKAVLRKEVKARRSLKQYVAVTEIFPEKIGYYVSTDGSEELRADADVVDIKERSVGKKVGPQNLGQESALKLYITGANHQSVLKKSKYYQDTLRVICSETSPDVPE